MSTGIGRKSSRGVGQRRRAGILIHPTSLSGPFGIGDCGPAAVRFLDWMSEAGLGVWQLLPLGPTGSENSPYAGLSAFAGSGLLISPQRLAEAEWLPRRRVASLDELPVNRVDFGQVRPLKERLLREAWRHFDREASVDAHCRFEEFIEHPDQSEWLEDWALFQALKSRFGGKAWTAWDEDLRHRDPSSLARAARELSAELAFERFRQFLFDHQWRGVRRAARRRGIALLGDAPYYVGMDSADVWAHQRLFKLGPDGRPLKVAGVPPDYFSETGQLWGNPVYDWEAMAHQGYAWWLSRIRANLRHVDFLRLDHFRGFCEYWEVDSAATTAIDGQWMPGPGIELFEAIEAGLGGLALIAEDLGDITDDVIALRDDLELPGMAILQFAFGGADNVHHPQRHRENSIVYTGTHDNDTTRGWFENLGPQERRRVLAELETDPRGIVDRMIDVAYESRARLAVFPAQDLLDLGSAARMNRPGVASGNWSWRIPADALTLKLAARLRKRAAASSRN